MSVIQKLNREELNQRYLMAMIGRVREALLQHFDQAGLTHGALDSEEELTDIRREMQFTLPLDIICQRFSLSAFERDILLLCAGVELDSSLVDLLQKTGDRSRKVHPTFGLALAALPEPHWSALSPVSSLRYQRLIEVNISDSLTAASLKIDECILHYLTGLNYYDERLNCYLKDVPLPKTLVPSHQAIIQEAAAAYNSSPGHQHLPLLQLYGNDSSSQYQLAAAISSVLGCDLKTIKACIIPHEPRETEALARFWDRQAAVTHSILLLDCTDVDNNLQAQENTIDLVINQITSTLIVAGRERRSVPARSSICFEIHKPLASEQLQLWKKLLPDDYSGNGLSSLVSQFDLNETAISAVCAEVLTHPGISNKSEKFGLLWNSCRAQSRQRLDELVQRITSSATLNDLVLPETPRRLISDIATQVRWRQKVYDEWGFGARISRGLGITALFSGSSGTGKTLAAEALANELRLDLFRIDLSSVVSKYIGETEKNLRRVFDAAEASGAILLFDEADALFGKRSEVKDSHDRYANIEVSYLLQRMEDYKGLAILTTNMKESMDKAFLRRIRFLVQFPFPNFEQRLEIWRHIFPLATPTAGLDYDKLARLNITGGNIKNVAIYAAFLAAEANQPIRMEHLLRAARVEYNKLEMALTESEIRGWL